MLEVRRISDFESGKFNCLVCKKELYLWYNGGELDEVHCCGHKYRTEHQVIDLVIYKIW